VEEINGNEKKLVVEIDRDISEIGESSFRRIVCLHHQEHMPLEVEIYTQTTMNFKPAIDHVGYFKYCH
jgi:predicted thioesterase